MRSKIWVCSGLAVVAGALLPVPSVAEDDLMEAGIVSDSGAGARFLQWAGKQGHLYQIETSSDLDTWEAHSGPFYSFGQPHSVQVASFVPPAANNNGGNNPPAPPAVHRSGHFMLDAWTDGVTFASFHTPDGPVAVRAFLDFHTGTENRAFFYQRYQQVEDDPANPGQQINVDYSVSLFLMRHNMPAPSGGGDVLTVADLEPEAAAKYAILSGMYATVYADLIADNSSPAEPHQHDAQASAGEREFFRVVEQMVDTDGDGIPDAEEMTPSAGEPASSPYLWDSDGDGVSDGDERAANTDPNDPESTPELGPPFWKASYAALDYVELMVESPLGSFNFVDGCMLNYLEFPYTMTPEEIDNAMPDFVSPEEADEYQNYAEYSEAWIDGEYGVDSQGNPQFSAVAEALRQWMCVDIAREHEIRESFLVVTERNHDLVRTYEAEMVEIVIPPKQYISNPVDLRPRVEEPDGLVLHTIVYMIPIETAPEVLAVNSDFDEGRIDSTTGYAIPDCDDMAGVNQRTGSGNTSMALEAHRDHLDGLFSQYERITDDMHPGWFGVNPFGTFLGNDFWDGATVTIRKVDQIDPETGHPESGQVRFYGKWGGGQSQYRGIQTYDFANLTLAPPNLATGGINGAAGSVYGESTGLQTNTQFWMEGVRPGKITLEWRYQKNAVDVTYEQTFLVETRKSPVEWKQDLAYKIRLDTSTDPSGEVDILVNPRGDDVGYWEAMERLSECYDYYAENFKADTDLNWSGLARLAGNQIVGGISDSMHTYESLEGGVQGVTTTAMKNEIVKVLNTFFGGGYDIFDSIGWQHHAYRSSGFGALRWTDMNYNDSDLSGLLEAWQLLDTGKHSQPRLPLKIGDAAYNMTDYEQNSIIIPTWVEISQIGFGLLDDIMTILAKNVTPGGDDFTDALPNGNLANAADRWKWISDKAGGTPNGILGTWKALPEATQLEMVGRLQKIDAQRFAVFNLIKINDHKDMP